MDELALTVNVSPTEVTPQEIVQRKQRISIPMKNHVSSTQQGQQQQGQNTISTIHQNMFPNEREQLVEVFLAASRNNDMSIVRECICRGVNVEVLDCNAFNALSYASNNGHIHIVKKYLVEQCHVNVTARQNNGNSALHLASRNGHLGIVRYFLQECRVHVETTNIDGMTALHDAAVNGHLKIVQCLIQESRANVEARNKKGTTPLHCASQMGHLDIVQYFIQECQVTMETQNNNGSTALQLARLRGHLDIIQYLLPLYEGVAALQQGD